jgi:predicted metal-dependent phosphotriesterase family hydrolase
VDLSKVNRNIATLFDDLERMVHETSRFREAGGTTLVDVTPRNVGRRPESWPPAGIASRGTSRSCPA